jgi:hypothetical protein
VSRSVAVVVVAVLIALALPATYALAGGTSYKPAASPDPCRPRHWPVTHGSSQVIQQLTLSALAGAACNLGVSQEELTLAFASKGGLGQFQRDHHISRSRLDSAARAGINRAIDDGEHSGQLNGIEATVLRLAAGAAPIDKLLSYVQRTLS